jgi:transcriptional regulator of aromatic amino acid metabolism
VSMLLNDVNLRCKISDNALKVSEKFTWEKNVNELEQTLYRL